MKSAALALLMIPAGICLLAMPANAALISGNTISCSGTGGITCSSPTVIAGSGTSFTITDTNLSSELGPDLFSANFGQNGFTLSVAGTPSTNGFFFFGGGASLIFSDATTPFTSSSLASTTDRSGGPVSTLANGNLTLALGPVEAFQGGEVNNYTLATAAQVSAVPLPNSAGLFLCAVIMTFGFLKFRSTKQV